ncbi:MAG: hypothetical protein ACK5H0_09340 [Bacteroidota bacterium]|jgi:hypothetical protein
MEVFKIHEQVRLHKGYLRGIAYDLPRQSYWFLPVAVIDAVQELEGSPIERLLERLAHPEIPPGPWADRLLNEEVIFLLPQAFMANFLALDLSYAKPGVISTAVLPLPQMNSAIVEVLERAGCQHLAVEVDPQEVRSLSKLWSVLDATSVNSVSLHLPHAGDLEKLLKRQMHAKVKQVYVHDGPSFASRMERGFALHYSKTLGTEKYFRPSLVLNQDIYLEAIARNTYFNRKIFLTRDGHVTVGDQKWRVLGRGKHGARELQTHLDSLETPAIWLTRKDKVSVCANCELRYMCVDPRVPKQRKDGLHYHETECSYNPYIAKWSDEPGFSALAECGIVSNAEAFSIDHDRIAGINSELWGE